MVLKVSLLFFIAVLQFGLLWPVQPALAETENPYISPTAENHLSCPSLRTYLFSANTVRELSHLNRGLNVFATGTRLNGISQYKKTAGITTNIVIIDMAEMNENELAILRQDMSLAKTATREYLELPYQDALPNPLSTSTARKLFSLAFAASYTSLGAFCYNKLCSIADQLLLDPTLIEDAGTMIQGNFAAAVVIAAAIGVYLEGYNLLTFANKDTQRETSLAEVADNMHKEIAKIVGEDPNTRFSADDEIYMFLIKESSTGFQDSDDFDLSKFEKALQDLGFKSP